MKKYIYIIIIALTSLMANAQDKKFPKIEDLSQHKHGDLIIKERVYKNKAYKNVDKNSMLNMEH